MRTGSPRCSPDAGAAGSWATNTTLAEVANWLQKKQRIVVLTHIKPDGDALGSTLGLVRTLNLIGPNPGGMRAHANYFGPCPNWAGRLMTGSAAKFLTDGQEPRADADAVVILDTGSWNQLEPVRGWLTPRAADAVILDHHAHGDPELASRRVIDVGAAAVCMVAAELCRHVMGLDSIAQLPPAVAEPLYLGIATDTGWFKHSNVNARALHAAADLLAAGADHAALYQQTEQADRPARVRLLARALCSLELMERERVAVLTLTRHDFAACGATAADAGGFADHVAAIQSVRAVVVLTEADAAEFGLPASAGTSFTKISLRSKPPAPDSPGVDVNQVARAFGGGGHVRAAGAKSTLRLEDVKRRVVSEIARQLDPENEGHSPLPSPG